MDSAQTGRPEGAVSPAEVGIGFDTPHAAPLPLDLGTPPRKHRRAPRRAHKAPRAVRRGRK